jgi:hypothetical protein
VGDSGQNCGRFGTDLGAEFSGFFGLHFYPFFGPLAFADLPVYRRFRDLRRRFWPVLDAFSNVLLVPLLHVFGAPSECA